MNHTTHRLRARRSLPRQRLVVALLIAWYASTAQSQDAPTGLVRLDAGREDTGPIATSSRLLPADLRAPTGFEHVYRGADDSLVRINGGLVATFPRSQYASSQSGPIPVIPAGTVFRIGLGSTFGPNVSFPAPTYGFSAGESRSLLGSPDARPSNALDLRASTRAPQPARTADPAGPRSLWEDEFYRSERVRLRLSEVNAAAIEPVDKR
jgi:hypothetical protein